jgi:hypothetical protein
MKKERKKKTWKHKLYDRNIILVNINLNNKEDKLVVGLQYRSPSEIAISDNTSHLLTLVNESTNKYI